MLRIRPMGKVPLLIIGHPGHEIRCHGWMSRVKPRVQVLTTGGGASKTGRLASTQKIIELTGASLGETLPTFSDHEIYGFLLDQNVEPLTQWTEGVAQVIYNDRTEFLLTDMVEGYNSSHDLVAYLTVLAVERAAALGWSVQQVLCQPLMGRPDRAWEGKLSPDITLELNDEEFSQKIIAAQDYPELVEEVKKAIADNTAESFRKECFYKPASSQDILKKLPQPVPFYETFGELQVSRGKFKNVIRHTDHLVPFAKKVRAALGLNAK